MNSKPLLWGDQIIRPISLPAHEGGGTTYTMPSVVYHYTHAEPLLSILSEGVLRCSDVRFMQDRQEVSHAVAMMKDQFDDARTESIDPNEREFLRVAANDVEFTASQPAYIACFTFDGDDPNQWRRYARVGKGYAVGFDSIALMKAGRAQGFRLVSCVYDRADQDAVLRSVLNRTRKEFSDVGISKARKPLMEFLGRFHDHALRFKSSRFRDEKEWRLVSTRTGQRKKPAAAEHWIRGSDLVPFYPFKLSYSSRLPISKVMVGERVDQRTEVALRELLRGMAPVAEVKRTRLAT